MTPTIPNSQASTTGGCAARGAIRRGPGSGRRQAPRGGAPRPRAFRLVLAAVGALVAGAASIAAAPTTAADPLLLSTPTAELRCTQDGLALTGRDGRLPRASGAGEALWTMRLQSVETPSATLVLRSRGQTPRVARAADGTVTLRYEGIREGATLHPLTLTLRLRAEDGSFVADGVLENRTARWCVTGFEGPLLTGLEVALERCPLLLPTGFGMKVQRTPGARALGAKGGYRDPAWTRSREGGGHVLRTPHQSSLGSMAWCAFDAGRAGLYLGCHDAGNGAKTILFGHDPATSRFRIGFEHLLACAPGASWALPPAVFRAYEGGWQEAARLYRKWHDAAFGPVRSPGWARQSSGWLLAILKQQNEEIHWDYDSIPQLCDIAEAHGLDTIGLFGWAEGGHDRWYPIYAPDGKLGGEARLKASLAEARRRNIRTILYANGQLIDQGYEYWDRQGKAISVLKADGKYASQSWQKYKDTPARLHALGCLACATWEETLLGLARNAERLGSDGILFDQLGMSGPMLCHAQGHGHPVPSVVYAADRSRALRGIADALEARRPGFIIMTEGLHDAVVDSVAYFHGCVKGVYAPGPEELSGMLQGTGDTAPFPDLFRTTFPEVVSTMRIPRPGEERNAANYACVYGFRHEIETRYAQDKAFLLTGALPAAADYDNIVSKPDVALLAQGARENAAAYLREMVRFQRAHAALLWEGRFVGSEGLTVRGPGTLVAKAYVAGERIGVVVWNTGAAPTAFSVEAEGWRLTEAFEPGRPSADAASPLAPQSVRLLTGKRR